MGYKVAYRGHDVQCDTSGDVEMLLNGVSTNELETPTTPPRSVAVQRAPAYRIHFGRKLDVLINKCTANQRTVLEQLRMYYPKSRSVDELMSKFSKRGDVYAAIHGIRIRAKTLRLASAYTLDGTWGKNADETKNTMYYALSSDLYRRLETLRKGAVSA